jgi:hypothetical protein
VIRSPLGPVPTPLRVDTKTLADPGAARITVRATATWTKTYQAPESGHLEEKAVWTLTFVRVAR